MKQQVRGFVSIQTTSNVSKLHNRGYSSQLLLFYMKSIQRLKKHIYKSPIVVLLSESYLTND